MVASPVRPEFLTAVLVPFSICCMGLMLLVDDLSDKIFLCIWYILAYVHVLLWVVITEPKEEIAEYKRKIIRGLKVVSLHESVSNEPDRDRHGSIILREYADFKPHQILGLVDNFLSEYKRNMFWEGYFKDE